MQFCCCSSCDLSTEGDGGEERTTRFTSLFSTAPLGLPRLIVGWSSKAFVVAAGLNWLQGCELVRFAVGLLFTRRPTSCLLIQTRSEVTADLLFGAAQ